MCDGWPQSGPYLAPVRLELPTARPRLGRQRRRDQFFEHREKLGMKLKRATADRRLILTAVKPSFHPLYMMATKAGGHSCPFGNAQGRGNSEIETKATDELCLRWLPVSALVTRHYLYCLRPSARSVQSGPTINQCTSGEAKVTGPDSHH